ncbi:hypothetical protein OS493_000349 [Desmophyllum pertusum]|uniref:BEN domain-containing protein n=1 Tax=Desmophyllum pertusum TaxID=174260 RepID=A0A9X0A836_9CNID|nr:hypothetical protein OS493_000349 [Desmophyllum pertusum]
MFLLRSIDLLLAEFLKEQSQKQADLKKKRSEQPKVQTAEASVQCGRSVVLKRTADASVQTDHYDVTRELKEQVQNLTEVVKQLTALKCIHQHEPKIPSSPLFEDDQLLDTALDPALASVIRSFCHNPTPSPLQESASTVDEFRPIQPPVGVNNYEDLSPVYHHQVTLPRQPLVSVDQNIVPLTLTSHGPTDEQRRKVGAIIDLGTDLSMTALACVDVLFTDDEMAKGNVSGSKGFQQLDRSKLHFLISLLQRKFDSPSFSENWSQIVARINTKCRGKRRTLIQRLKKHTFS